MTRTAGRRIVVESGERRSACRCLVVSWLLPKGRVLEARVPLDGAEGGAAAARVLGAGEPEALASAGVRVVHDAWAGLWHAEAPGVLVATWRAHEDGAIRLVYARTELTGVLGLAGGTYELREPVIEE